MFSRSTANINNIRPGLALAALFGWLLSFPMFGPLLAVTAGENTLALGLCFVASHAVGLMLIPLLPLRFAVSPVTARAAGALVVVLTGIYALAHGNFLADALVMAALGVTAACLVLAWAKEFVRYTRPLPVLMAAMAAANVIYGLISIPVALPAKELLILLGVPAGLSVLFFQTPQGGEAAQPSYDKSDTAKTIKALAAFIVAVYFIGGIWYHSFAISLTAAPLWEASIGALFYTGSIILLAYLTVRSQPGDLAPLSLSALGVGLLIMLSGLGLSAAEFAYLIALNLGLAAADLFLWYALWFLGKTYGGLKSFGFGLGFSLILIMLSVILSAMGWPGGSPALLLITALVLLFLIVPLIFRYPFRQLHHSEKAETAAAKSDLPNPPDILTPTESMVYQLLIQGSSDAEMAAAMFISRHTVKFHVRNILRKTGAANRKELLSTVIQQEREQK